MTKNKEKNRSGRIVIIDDDEATRLSLGQMFKLRKYEVETFPAAETALAWPKLENVDCIISDVKMIGMDGEAFLAEMVSRKRRAPVIMITGHGDVPMAVRCLKAGAYDFVEKPFDDELLLASVARAVEKNTLEKESEKLKKRLENVERLEKGRHGMVGNCRAMKVLYQQMETFAKSDAPVLVLGETGAGKELVARALHNLSRRVSGPFVPVNAGALPETTLESEIFGHTKGAFTGASTSRDGKLVTASGGTLLLDEIEGLTERAQMQLLRVIEDGLVEPLGEDKPKKVDVRLLATTKVDLLELVKRGRMREDFYHRIVVLSIMVPPLRERMEDLPLLISHFMRLASERNRIDRPDLPEKTLSEMMKYPWPGNIRELKNQVERMVITSRDGIAGPFEKDEASESSRLLSIPATAGLLRDKMEYTEREVIESALKRNRGEINATSETLGISRRALYERMKKYDLNKENYKQ